MNDGLKILLERMDTNPEEFQNSLRSNRWESLFKKYEPYLTAEEKAGWAKKVTELNRQAFTNEVMKELLMADGEDEIETALRPSRLIIAPNMQNEALTILAGGGGGGNGGGYGGGDSGSVTIKTPTGTHTFTKSGTFTP
jgi:hypothetical protein